MDDSTVERIFAIGIEVGVINLAAELGLISEFVSQKQAEAKYTKEIIDEMRRNGWIVAYPSGNKHRYKFNYKRSELETAWRMYALKNVIGLTKLDRIIENYRNEKLKAKEDKKALKKSRKRLRD
jgi:3-hydroxy-3-methylglutaryl CoA synthase